MPPCRRSRHGQVPHHGPRLLGVWFAGALSSRRAWGLVDVGSSVLRESSGAEGGARIPANVGWMKRSCSAGPHFSPAAVVDGVPHTLCSLAQDRRGLDIVDGHPGRVPIPSRAVAPSGKARLRQREC